MNQKISQSEYKPGYYIRKRLSIKEWIDKYLIKWEQTRDNQKTDSASQEIPTSICFSREIGVGALEIADALAKILDIRVVDREIIEHLAIQTNLTKKLIGFYDQRYPGKMQELYSRLILNGAFIESDYARQLVKTILALSGMAPTIFVGRGTHLLLPRQRVLSVRLICSREYRLNRLADLIESSRDDLEKKVRIIDSEQNDFFKKIYQKRSLAKDEFDIVIYRDFFGDADKVAKIIACAYEQRFGENRVKKD